VKKLVPIDRVTTENTCESDCFRECALFKEALARAERSVDADSHPTAAAPKGATP
jgi:hypothetical protein